MYSSLTMVNQRRGSLPDGRVLKGLDSEAEVDVLLVAGVGVGVVGGAVVEPISLAEFAANEEAQSHGAQAGGDPAHGLDEGGLFFTLIAVSISVVGEGDGAVDGRVLGGSASSRDVERNIMIWMIAQARCCCVNLSSERGAAFVSSAIGR